LGDLLPIVRGDLYTEGRCLFRANLPDGFVVGPMQRLISHERFGKEEQLEEFDRDLGDFAADGSGQASGQRAAACGCGQSFAAG
jgi:hypothetical protein